MLWQLWFFWFFLFFYFIFYFFWHKLRVHLQESNHKTTKTGEPTQLEWRSRNNAHLWSQSFYLMIQSLIMVIANHTQIPTCQCVWVVKMRRHEVNALKGCSMNKYLECLHLRSGYTIVACKHNSFRLAPIVFLPSRIHGERVSIAPHLRNMRYLNPLLNIKVVKTTTNLLLGYEF